MPLCFCCVRVCVRALVKVERERWWRIKGFWGRGASQFDANQIQLWGNMVVDGNELLLS